jgi:hypothetical protein
LTSSKPNERPNPDLTKSQAIALNREQKLIKMIKELSQLHTGDASYQEQDLKNDLKHKCERSGIRWDENLIDQLLKVKK